MDNIIYINLVETVLLGLSLIFLFLITFKKNQTLKWVALILLLVPPMYLAVEGATQFLSADPANHHIQDYIHIRDSDTKAWHSSVYRTSNLVISSFLAIITKYTYVGMTLNDNELKMLAKTIHWLLGFLIIVIIYYLIDKFYIENRQKAFYFLIYFYSILLLPLNIFALKVITYDLLSMLLGVLTIVLFLIALKMDNVKYALLSIIVGMFAAQEKHIASPILLIAMLVFSYLKLKKSENVSFTNSLIFSFYAISTAFFTSLISFFIVAIVAKNGSIPSIDFAVIVNPIIAYYVIISRIFEKGAFSPVSAYFIFLNGFILAFVSLTLVKFKDSINRKVFQFLTYLKPIYFLASSVVILVGIAGSYLVEAFYYPYSPILLENYFPLYSFNSQVLHFGVQSFFVHIISFIGYTYAVFLSTIPTVYLVIIVLSLIFWKNFYNRDIFAIWLIIFTIVLAVPLFYAIAHIPVFHRYFNLFTFLIILITGLKFTYLINDYTYLQKSGIILLFCLLLIVEILPFRPVFGAFKPVWNKFSEEFNKTPTIGQVNTAWLGHGEEIFIFGKKIEKTISFNQNKIYLHPVNIYEFKLGEWLTNNKMMVINSGKYGFTKSDYYIVNRLVITQGISFFFENIEPLFTLSYRGYEQAWVYRGDQLKHKFGNNTRELVKVLEGIKFSLLRKAINNDYRFRRALKK
jgi:hypothetical protein